MDNQPSNTGAEGVSAAGGVPETGVTAKPSAPLPFCKKRIVPAKVNRPEALRYLGHTGQQADPELMDRFERNATTCENGSVAFGCWATFAIDQEKSRWLGHGRKNPQVALKHGPLSSTAPVLTGKSINQHLRGATHVVLMAVTAGLKNESVLRQLNATSPTDALLYSSCGSSLVEEAADAVNAQIESEATAAGLYCNWRFSPGYGDLPLEVQPAFLAALDAQRAIGLSLTPTNLLIPTKSVTAIVGLFEAQPPVNPPNPCNGCVARMGCPFIEKGTTCHGIE